VVLTGFEVVVEVVVEVSPPHPVIIKTRINKTAIGTNNFFTLSSFF